MDSNLRCFVTDSVKNNSVCWQSGEKRNERVGGITGFSRHLRAKLRDWANRQAGAGCDSLAEMSSNDLKTR